MKKAFAFFVPAGVPEGVRLFFIPLKIELAGFGKSGGLVIVLCFDYIANVMLFFYSPKKNYTFFSIIRFFLLVCSVRPSGRMEHTSHQPPATSHQPPATSHQPPATSHQPPATSHQPQPPATSHQPPATSHQPPATSHQPPATSHQPPGRRAYSTPQRTPADAGGCSEAPGFLLFSGLKTQILFLYYTFLIEKIG